VSPRAPGRLGELRPLAFLTALAFLVQVDARMMTPLLPAIAQSLETSVTAMGFAMMLYMLPYGLFQFVYGPLGDRQGAIQVVRWAAIGFAAAAVLTGQASHVLWLDVTRFLTGVFAAAVVPLTFAYIGATVPYAERHATLGRFAAVTSLAQSLSAAIGGTVAHFVSWRVLYVGVGCLTLLPAICLFRVAPGAEAAGAPGGALRYGLVLRRRAARVLYGIVAFEGLFLWGGFTYLGAVAVARFGLNELQVGLLLASYGAATLVGGMSLVRLRPHVVREHHLAAVGGGLKGGGYLLMAASDSLPLFALAIVMLGFGYIALHTTLQTRATELAPEARGTAVALFAFFLFVGGAAGSALFGPLVDHGWHRLFLAICGVSLLALGGFAVALLEAAPGRD
jgi:predicted MFS family arabinose efflux permease